MATDCRKSVRDLTEGERRDFVDAVLQLKQSGEYDEFVRQHFETTYEQTGGSWTPKSVNDAHRGPAFLPWHRKYLREFERKLQEKVPGVTLPYWNWAEDAALAEGASGTTDGVELPVFAGDPADPADGLLGDDGVLDDGPVEDAFNTTPTFDWDIEYRQADFGIDLIEYADTDNERLERPLDFNAEQLPRPRTVESALAIDTFDEEPYNASSNLVSFRNVLEGFATAPDDLFPDVDGDGEPDPPSSKRQLHNYVHGWVGGDMGNMTSPNDPVFFLHHCYVDKIWADWQERYPDAEQFPPNGSSAPDGHRLGTQMSPWNIDPADAIDHREMGYVYDTSAPTVELVRPSASPTTLDFNDVPQGRETSRAAVFEVVGCDTPVTLTVSVADEDGPFSIKPGMESRTHTPDPTTNEVEAPVWVTYTAGSPGSSPSGQATVHCPETGQSWTIQLTANAIEEPTAGVALVLDESGSMSAASGDGSRTRIEVLRDAGHVFLDLLPAGSSLGIATFHSDASAPFPTQSIGGAGDSARSNAETTIGNLSPTTVDPATDAGYTSIGDGVIEGRGLVASASDVEERAIVVFTDGHENRPEYIADLEASPYDEQLFAVGLGTPAQVRPAALQQLTGAGGPHEGYVLVSGTLTVDDQFLLDKYFVQILAGVTNSDVVVDPEGRLGPESANGQGRTSIPFEVSGADLDLEVVLLAPKRQLFTLTLETPDGSIVEAGDLAAAADEQVVEGERVQAFRLPLPYATDDGEAHGGRWYAHIDAEEKAFDRYLAELERSNLDEYERTVASGAPYSLLVNARSNLDFDASIRQSGFEPGARLRLRAGLDESGLPLAEATVTADYVRPDGARTRLGFDPVESGTFEAVVEDADAGHHSFRVRATGTTLDGDSFVRERILTAGTWIDGNRPLPSRDGRPAGADSAGDLTGLLSCLLREGALDEYLDAHDVDEGVVRECLDRKKGTTGTGSGPSLAVSDLHVDADANDYENLNDEYVEFENTGDEAIDLTGWTVEDEAGHVYVFPKGSTLAAGATVRLRSGAGSNTKTDLYWGSKRPVWNNEDDTVSVYDTERNLVASRSY